MHLNLECPNLPQKSHLSKTSRDLEDVVPFSKPRPDLSWGCWWNFKKVVRVFELSKNFLNSLVRHATSSLSFSTVEVSSDFLLEFVSSFQIFIWFPYISVLKNRSIQLFFKLFALKENHMIVFKKNIIGLILFIIWWSTRKVPISEQVFLPQSYHLNCYSSHCSSHPDDHQTDFFYIYFHYN